MELNKIVYTRRCTFSQRVLESEEISVEVKEKLRVHYLELNPVALLKLIEKKLEKLFSSVEKRY